MMAILKLSARRYARETSGMAAVEVVFWLAALVPALFNIVDLGTYVFQRMQVENAAQMGAQAAWAACESPPEDGCGSVDAVNTAVAAALASTSLGDKVEQSGELEEGYYCPDPDAAAKDQTLVAVTDGTSTCASGAKAGYYVKVVATYPYAPIIATVSLATLLDGDITQTAWSRVK